MIREFAVEPESLSQFNVVWQALEQFGVSHGRMISDFPKGWLREVYAATAACRDLERKTLEIRLNQLKRKVVRFRSGRPSDPNLTWRQNVHAEDLVEPFHAMIQRDNVEKHERVLTEFELHDDNPLWRSRAQDNVPRTPEALATVLAPLGKISRELLFVDPHFSTEARWSRVFVESLFVCGVRPGTHNRIEIHTGPTPSRAFLEQRVNERIAPRLQRGVRVRFVLWEQKEDGEKLHARYFLTERGGIRFDVGLDAGELGETTDVSLLSDDLHQSRWDDFQDKTCAYSKVDEFTVTGTL